AALDPNMAENPEYTYGVGDCVSALGPCGCGNFYQVSLTLSDEWQSYQYSWEDFTQGPYGAQADFDATTITFVNLTAAVFDTAYDLDLWIDNFGFTLPSGAPVEDCSGGGGAGGAAP
ncbi:MAG TPA: hypothetical protein VM686_20550, partial [Polyangiaceae bacterium]|nr:hypothetical protein [Polyangiaceae bacterium]